MLSPENVYHITMVGSFIIGTVGYLARQWYNIKKVMERVQRIEEHEATYVTRRDHERLDRDIYRDLKALEKKIESIDNRLEKGETQREQARAEDLKWKTEMQEVVVEIRTIVKRKLS